MKVKFINSSLAFVTKVEPVNLYDAANDVEGKKIVYHVSEGTAESACLSNFENSTVSYVDVTPGSTIRFSFIPGEHYDAYNMAGIGLQNSVVTKGYESQQNEENWNDRFFTAFTSSDGRKTRDISIPSNVSRIWFVKRMKGNNMEYESTMSDIKVYEIS